MRRNNDNKKTKYYIKNLILVFLGFFIVILIGGFYFWSLGTLDTYIFPIFSFLQKYGPFFNLKQTILKLVYFPIIWIFSLITIIPILYKIYNRKIGDNELLLLIWAVVFFGPLYISYAAHYFIPLLAPICILASISLFKILSTLSKNEIKLAITTSDYKKIFTLLCLFGIILSSFSIMAYKENKLQEYKLNRFESQIHVSDYIKRNTLDDEKILSFAFDPSIYIYIF